ncbi:MAG: hybrid sensor histidine kinase/response regulator [Caldimonas sp.]
MNDATVSTPGEGFRAGDDEAFRRLVDSVRDYAIIMLTPEGRIASWNAGARWMKGYAADEVIGKHFSIFHTPEAIESGWPDEELRRALALGHFEDEGWRVRKDGSRFWADAIIAPVRGASGELLGFSKVTRDLTERRANEERLREGERSLRLLVEGVQDYAIFMLDREGVIASWNLGAQRIKGYSAAEAIGKHFSVFYLPQDVQRGWPTEELKRARELGRYEDEGWRVRKDGTRIWANVIITAVFGENGELRGYSKVTRDLTERRRHEAELEEREENLRLLVEGVKDHAMFLLDPAGRIRTWNAGARRLLGFDAGQVIEQDAALLYKEDDRHAGRPGAELASARSVGSLQLEGWRRRADGTEFWAEVSTTALPGTDGEARGFVQIIRDLTERRRVEELENEGRRISEFIAMLSHELRNPLAPIRNAVAILKRFAGVPEAAWCVELIGRQVAHMTRLVDDLLDVTRISTGKIRLESRPFELNQLVRTAVDAVSSSIREYGHLLDVRLPQQDVPIAGDATRLLQVLVNLLTNAAKYTPDKGVIQVSVVADGPVARLQVVDNGIGMSNALLQRAFDPFVQGSRALDRPEGGLGIGLTLVKNIVELHGGTVTAASAGVGRGATFTVSLPMAGSATVEKEPGPPGPSVAATTVLVVDDNRDAAESLAMLLELTGHEVRVAHDGAEALDLAAGRPPHVVLLDLGLPGMDGFEVARRLRAIPAMADAQLIAVTGYGQESDRQATQAAGFTNHLTKPVDMEELARIMAQPGAASGAAPRATADRIL